MLFGQPEARHVCYGFQRIQAATHIRFRRNGRHRSSLPRRSLSLDDLANAARQYDQLGNRYDGHRAVDDLSSPEASPLPLVLVGLLIAVFLGMEARRYRYVNVWRARARWLERNFWAPIFSGEARDDSWQATLARDYTAPRHHISFFRAAGRRLRRNYVWILAIQALAYYGKIAIHPMPAATLAEFSDRAAVGPIPGWIVLMIGFAYNFGWLAFALGTMWLDQREHGAGGAVAMG